MKLQKLNFKIMIEELFIKTHILINDVFKNELNKRNDLLDWAKPASHSETKSRYTILLINQQVN